MKNYDIINARHPYLLGDCKKFGFNFLVGLGALCLSVGVGSLFVFHITTYEILTIIILEVLSYHESDGIILI